MKLRNLISRIALPLGLAALATAGFAQIAPRNAFISMVVTAGADVDATEWADIKDHTYETRAQFFVGFQRLETKVQRQINELTALRASLTGSTSTADWDFAMKEMQNARAALKSTGEELGKATAETWNEQKDRVGQAWVRTQEAYAKVRASTTA